MLDAIEITFASHLNDIIQYLHEIVLHIIPFLLVKEILKFLIEFEKSDIPYEKKSDIIEISYELVNYRYPVYTSNFFPFLIQII